MSTRRDLWDAGFNVFPEHPLLGVGAGTYGAMLKSQGRRFLPAHNLAIGLLVEQGIVGLSLFAALLGACFLTVFRMPPPDRKVWAVLMLCWLVGTMSLSVERWKVTWLFFGLLSAQSGFATPLRHVRRSERKRVDANEQAGLPGITHAPRAARIAVSR